MQSTEQMTPALSYAKAVEVSNRIRWDIEKDVIRGRSLDFTKKFSPTRPGL
jgi:hypothetical protein